MRIAIQLSGMLRNYENSYLWLNESILDILKNNNIEYDIFISNWLNKEDDHNIYNLFTPKIMESEIWDDEIIDKLGWPEFKKCKYEIEPRASCLGQFYKIYQCNELRKKYELENHIKYDVIIRCRTELKYNTNIDVKELKILEKNQDKPIIFLRKGPNPQHIGENAWTKDNFAIMNRWGADIYSDCFNHLLNISKSTQVCTAELILRNWLYSHKNLDIFHTSCDYSIKRD